MMSAPDIDTVWDRIEGLDGETFRQKRGQPFTYSISGRSLYPSTTNQALPKSQFAKALEFVPIAGPGVINHLRGPSYLWAILMDPRVRRTDW